MLKFEICSRGRDSAACFFGGSWREKKKSEKGNYVTQSLLSRFVIDLFWIFGRNKERGHKHTL